MPEQGSCVKQIKKTGNDIVVELTGAVDLHHTPDLHKTLIGACDERPPRLVVDLGEVSYMDSSGIGTLVEVLRRVNAYKGQLLLSGPNERVRGVFEITRLDKFFRIYSNQSEALSGE